MSRHRNIKTLNDREFETLCQLLLPDIAEWFGEEVEGPPSPMGDTYDGGVEGKIKIVGGCLAIQCKNYLQSAFSENYKEKKFQEEIKSVAKSFETFLSSNSHCDVIKYVWCSLSSKTKKNEELAQNAVNDMKDDAQKQMRTVSAEILFAEDLEQLIKEKKPNALLVLDGSSTVTEEAINYYSCVNIKKSMHRPAGNASSDLTYVNQRTEQILKEFDADGPENEMLSDLDCLNSELKRRNEEHDGIECIVDLNTAVDEYHSNVLNYLECVKKSAVTEAVISDVERSTTKTNKEFKTILANINKNEDLGARNLVSYIYATYSRLCRQLEDHLVVTKAKLRGEILIVGKWGTGKTYNLAKYADSRLKAGKPTLFLRARDFTDQTKSILSQSWRQHNLDPALNDEEFLACISHISIASNANVVLIVDGINESHVSKKTEYIETLRHQVSQHGGIKLVLSERCDNLVSSHQSIPCFIHTPPDPKVVRRNFEEHAKLGHPIPRTLVGILENPLMATISFRVAKSEGMDALSTFYGGHQGLIRKWSDLVIRETSDKLNFERMTIRQIFELIERRHGTVKLFEIADELRLGGDDVNRIASHLVDEGILERKDSVSVGYHWQAVGRVLELSYLIEKVAKRQRKKVIRELLDRTKDDDLTLTARTLAEIAPIYGFELLDVVNRSDLINECGCAFADSLESRTESSINNHTVELAKSQIKNSGDAGSVALVAMMSREIGSKIGIRAVLQTLQESSNFERGAYWPYLVHHIVGETLSLRQRFLESLSYLETEFKSPQAKDSAVKDIMRFLMWLGCCRRPFDVNQISASLITELLYLHDSLFADAIGYCSENRDDHLFDMLLVGAHGVLMRWPNEDPSGRIRSHCKKFVDEKDLSPKSITALSELYEIIDPGESFYRFLRKYVDIPKFNWEWKKGGFIRENHRSMFADRRSSMQAERFETAVCRTVGGLVHLWSTDPDPSVSAFSFDFVDSHRQSLVYGRWAAIQSGYYKFSDGVSVRDGRLLKAGSKGYSELVGGEGVLTYLKFPSKWWRNCVDPSLPSQYLLEHIDSVTPSVWWAVNYLDNATASCLVVTDREGSEWVVVRGEFRFEEPARSRRGVGLNYRIESGLYLAPYDDGYPPVGLNRHESVVVRSWFEGLEGDGLPDDDHVFHNEGECRYAEAVSDPDTSGEVSIMHNTVPTCFIPSKRLLDLLDCRWTGWDAVCKSDDGVTVVFDPGVGQGGPHALLVRKSRLLTCLNAKGLSLRVDVRCVEPDGRSGRKVKPPMRLSFPKVLEAYS